MVSNTAPYALAGTSGGSYNAMSFPAGVYSLSATAYGGPDGTGQAGNTYRVNFSVAVTQAPVDVTVPTVEPPQQISVDDLPERNREVVPPTPTETEAVDPTLTPEPAEITPEVSPPATTPAPAVQDTVTPVETTVVPIETTPPPASDGAGEAVESPE
jgi:hypothetical protein